jgi:exonuclease III
MPNENGPFKDHLTRDIGANLKVCHFNIEGISRDKCEVLSKLMNNERVDVIALQETHTVDDKDLEKRGYIPGYLLLGSIHHKQYVIATYVKEDIDDLETITKSVAENIFILVTRISDVNIANIYKTPSESWSSPPIKVLKHPAIYIGDFNSNSTA